VIVVREVYEFTIEKVSDISAVSSFLRFIYDVLTKNGYRVSYEIAYKRVKIEIEGKRR
jgi:hypothetical protein